MRYSAQGPNEFSDLRYVADFKVVDFKFGDLVSGAFKVPVEPGEIVLGVALEIVSGFTGTTAVIVGDGAANNGYIPTGVVTPTTAGSYVYSGGSTGTFKTGKKYATLDSILATFTGTATAGEGKLHIHRYSTKGDWRVPAS